MSRGYSVINRDDDRVKYMSFGLVRQLGYWKLWDTYLKINSCYQMHIVIPPEYFFLCLLVFPFPPRIRKAYLDKQLTD